MSNLHQVKECSLHTTRLRDERVSPVGVPSPIEQRPSTSSKDSLNNSTSQTNIMTPTNRIYTTEVRFNQIPTKTIIDDVSVPCHKCKRLINIKNGNKIKFNNRSYHSDCFTCANCHRKLTDSSNKTFQINDDEEPICSQCQLSEAETCYVCRKAILNEGEIIFNKNSYHKNCFNCIQCHKSLVHEKDLREYNLKPVCIQCYNERFAPKCVKCSEVISNEKITNYNGKKYHSACFQCDQCDQVITEMEFATHNSEPCCLKCYEKNFAPKCAQCLKSIPDGEYINYDNNKYHLNCFRCDQCNRIIYDSKFHTRNSKPCCNQCYDHQLALQCDKCQKSISVGEYITYDNKKYHSDCFRCGQCYKVITDTKFATYDSKPCCNQCYDERFASQCAQCNKSIPAGKYVTHDNKKYHSDCFRCGQCERIIYDSTFHTEYSKPCCNQCYDHKFASKCEKCGKTISVGRTIIYDRKTYHPDCFCCSQCKRVITEKEVHTHDSKPYCDQCYDESVMLRCSECSRPIIDKYTTFQGKYFHLHCFVCTKCHRIIYNREEFVNGKHGVLCSRCSV